MEARTKITPQQFGRELREFLRDHDLEVGQAATHIGYSSRQMNRYFHGEKRITRNAVTKLEGLAGISDGPLVELYDSVDWSLIDKKTTLPSARSAIRISDQRARPPATNASTGTANSEAAEAGDGEAPHAGNGDPGETPQQISGAPPTRAGQAKARGIGEWTRRLVRLHPGRALILTVGAACVAVVLVLVTQGGPDDSGCVPSAGAPSFCFPEKKGPVWVRVTTGAAPTTAYVRWGPNMSPTENLPPNRTVYLTLEKNSTASVPIQAFVHPSVPVKFSMGIPPAGAKVIALDHGWKTVP